MFKKFADPVDFTGGVVFHFPGLCDMRARDEAAFIGLKMNWRSLEGPALKLLPESKANGTGLTVDQLKANLVAGATWRSPKPALVNEPDGAPMICAYCGDLKQPIKYMGVNSQTGEPEEKGNFLYLTSEKLGTLKESDPDLLVAAEAHTLEIVGSDASSAMPKFVRVIFVCEDEKSKERRRKVFLTYLSRASVFGRLQEKNAEIKAEKAQRAVNALIGSKRKDPRARREAYRKYGVEDRRGNRRSDRPEKPKAVFTGSDGSAEFEAATVEAFRKAGVNTLAEIAAASNERLAQIGAISSPDHEPAAKSVRYRAQSALERTAKADSTASVAESLSVSLGDRVPEELSELRHKPAAGRKTGRKGARFAKKGDKK